MSRLFKVKSRADIKTTFAWGEEIALRAAIDYETRFGKAEIEEVKEKDEVEPGKVQVDFFLDFGGIMLGTMRPHVVEVRGIRVGFWPHQEVYLMDAIDKALQSDRGGFFKLHAAHICMCLPGWLLEGISDTVKAESGVIGQQADLQFEDWKEGKKQ